MNASRLAAAAALLAAGCTGTPSGVPLTPPGSPYASDSASKALTAVIRILVPNVTPALDPHFVVANTESASVDVYVHGSKHLVTSAVADLARHSHDCKKTSTGRRCSFSVTLPHPADYDFVARTYDRIPKHGKIPPAAKQLAAGVATRRFAKNGAVPLVLGGVVASTSLSLTVTTGHAIDPLSESITVEALDADGNTIVTNGYVDANGHPVTITPEADSNAAGTIAFAPASFTQPQTSVALDYSPAHMTNAQATNGFSSVLSITASNGAAAGTQTVAFAAPVITYATPLTASRVDSITVGPDQNLWFVQYSSALIGSVTPSGIFSQFGTGTAGANPNAIATGPDDAMYFTTQSGNAIGRVTTTGTVSSFTIPTANSHPDGITKGPDGALWFSETSPPKIGRVTTSGSFTEYPLLATSRPVGIVSGPDGALWFADCSATGAIGRISTTGTLQSFPTGFPAFQLVTVPDGTLWFTGCAAKLGHITTGGTVTTYTIPGDGVGIAVGPDGQIWFAITTSGGNDYIARMTLDGNTMTLYSIEGNNPFPVPVIAGPDGAIWFGTINSNQVGRLQ